MEKTRTGHVWEWEDEDSGAVVWKWQSGYLLIIQLDMASRLLEPVMQLRG